jgi:DNA-directed RNA polymerase specialized sigma24 family protein
MYFPTTHWSLLAKATLSGETEARSALDELCRRYWTPLNQFIRQRGYHETEAEDITQAFLLHLMERSAFRKPDRLKGRFRSFLLGALVRFLADERDARLAQKRGQGAAHLSLHDDETPEPAADAADATLFDREWAVALLENALRQVEKELGTADDGPRFAVMKQFLPGSVAVPSYEEAAARLGLSLPALKSEVHRLRQRFRSLVRQEIAGTVSAPHEIDEEMHYLQTVLLHRGHDFTPGAKPSSAVS